MKKPIKSIYFLRKISQLILGAVVIGTIGGLGGILYLALVNTIFNFCFLGIFSLSYNVTLLAPESKWGIGIILVPVFGSLVVTWLIKTFGANERGVSSPELLSFINQPIGNKSYSIELSKTVASTITIGTGGSVGQEVPIVQLGAALSYLFTKLLNLSSKERLVLLAAGSAASLSAVFNVPFTGIMFAIEILLFAFNILAVVLIAIAAFMGAFIGQLVFGAKIVYTITLFPIELGLSYVQNALIFIIFGIFLGLFSVLFNAGLNRTELLFLRVFKNVYLRHAVGMVIVGFMLYGMIYYTGHYYIDKLGHATIQQVMDSILTNPNLLSIILVCKLFSLWITLGSGASGGIFTPSLFLGAITGALFSIMLQHFFPGLTINPIYFIICGMGGMLAGFTGCVLTAIVFILEISHSFHVVLFLVLTVFFSVAIRLFFYPRGIYSFKLFQRGLMFERKWW